MRCIITNDLQWLPRIEGHGIFRRSTSINASRGLSAIAQFLVLIIVGYICLFLLLSTNKQRSILLSRGVIRNILFVGYFGVRGRLLHTVPSSNRPATGIALLKDQLFVTYDQQVAVYCPTTFEMQHYLPFYCAYCRAMSSELAHHNHRGCYSYVHGNIQYMVACDFSNCLYAASQNNSICKFALGQNNTLYSWSVGSNPRGLSVTSSHNLLVATTGDNCLSEYSTGGNLLRQISLQPTGISNPVHAVQISEDQFAVTHHGPTHQFSIVGSDGQLIRSYSGNAGDLSEPRGIAADERGRVFVADQSNNRILVISCNSMSARRFILPPDCTLDGPYCLHYDSANKRLYIGEESGGRVVCCQLWNVYLDDRLFAFVIFVVICLK